MAFDRAPAVGYIAASLRSLYASGPRAAAVPVHVVVDGPDASFIHAPAAGVHLRLHAIPRLTWEDQVRHWQVHRRIAYSYHRCFEIALRAGRSGLLVCEDDVAFRPQFLDRLRAVLTEMAAGGRTAFVLSLYDPHHDNREADAVLRRGDLYGVYPGDRFYGGQAVYFSGPVLSRARDVWAERGWRSRPCAERPNDLLIGDFGEGLARGHGDAGGIYGVYRSLVQHTGNGSSTGLSAGYHWSNTFDQPWHDE